MKRFITMLIVSGALLLASNHKVENNETSLTKKHVQEQMKREEKYAKEQKFYNEKNYDFKSAEVNPDSLKDLPELEVNDMDMDDVYD